MSARDEMIAYLLKQCLDLLDEAEEVRDEKRAAMREFKFCKAHAFWNRMHNARYVIDRCKAKGRELQRRLDRIETRARLIIG